MDVHGNVKPLRGSITVSAETHSSSAAAANPASLPDTSWMERFMLQQAIFEKELLERLAQIQDTMARSIGARSSAQGMGLTSKVYDGSTLALSCAPGRLQHGLLSI